MGAVGVERCEECGFDGDRWTDEEAVEALAGLPGRWAAAIDGLSTEDLQRRPIGGMWSIAEYTDHVRETTFAMRYLLDTALAGPGTDLGDPPQPRFDPEPRAIDTTRALRGFRDEVHALCDRLRSTPFDLWGAGVTVGGEHVDIHWVARHAVHDITHHLGDIDRLRSALRGR